MIRVLPMMSAKDAAVIAQPSDPGIAIASMEHVALTAITLARETINKARDAPEKA